MTADFLASRLDIAFNHHAFHQIMDVRGNPAVVHDFLDNADLLFILLIGIRMVRVDDGCVVF